MANFGDFETLEELHRSTSATVWTARSRRAGDGAAFAVKVSRPADWLEEGADPAPAFAALAESVEDERALEKKQAQYWAPVVAAGADESEAYRVSRLYPRSLQTVLERRALLPPQDIHWIATAVARGLAELDTHLKRPHGNLKASNIFIDGEGRLQGLKVLLAELKPREQLVELEDQVADFRELGRLIVLIVRRRPADMRKPIGWPIEEGAEWKRFGGQGVAWREFCNGLLNPHPAPADLDWKKVEARLLELTPRDRKPLIIAAAIALPVALLIGGAGYLRFTTYEELRVGWQQDWALKLGNIPKDLLEVPVEWGKLCDAYLGWLGTVDGAMADKDGRATAAWPSYLKDNVVRELAQMVADYQSINPRKLGKLNREDPDLADLQSLIDTPPDSVKKGVVADKIRKVYRAAERAAEALTKWPDRQKLDETGKRFTQLGWKDAADEVQRAYERSAPRAASDPLVATDPLAANAVDGIKRVLDLKDRVANAESLWGKIKGQVQTLAAGGDPVMKGVEAFLRTRVASSSDLKALNLALADATQDAGSWLGEVIGADGQSIVDRERFARESAIKSFSGELSADVIEQWKREIKEFQYLPEDQDPRRKTELAAVIAKVDAALGELRKVREEEKNSPDAAEVTPKAESAIKSRDDEGRLHAELIKPRLVRRDLTPKSQEATAMIGRFEKLNETVMSLVGQLQGDPAEFIKKLQQVALGAAGSALQDEWNRRRGQLLAGAEPTALRQNKTAYNDLKANGRKLEDFFRFLAGPGGVGLFPAVDLAGVAAELVPPLQQWAGKRTDRALVEWLGAVTWSGLVPAVKADEFVAGASPRAVVERLKADFAEAAKLGVDFGVIADRLAQGYGIDDAATAKLTTWTQQAQFTELLATGPFKGLLDAKATLDTLLRETSSAKLVEAAAAPTLGIALSAWQQLGKLPTWPKPEPAELNAELKLAADLRQRMEAALKSKYPERLQELIKGWAEERVSRWRKALRSSPDDDILANVLARRDEFGVTPDRLLPEDRFNVELQRLKQIDWRKEAGDGAVAKRDQEVEKLRAALGAQSSAQIKDVQDWMKRLLDIELTDKDAKKTDVTKLGPGSVGWAGELSADSRQIIFRRTLRTQEQKLGFVFVDVDGFVPFYLGTTELSAGLLVDLASDAAVNTSLQKWLRTVADDAGDKEAVNDPRNGPRVWRLDRQRRIQLSAEWTGTALPNWPKPIYATDIPDPGKPGRDAPAQYLPPEAALYIAEKVLGSRLLTVDEWNSVVASGVAKSNADSKGPNLRDAVWLKERDYFVKARVADLPIEAEIFWPANMPNPKRGAQAERATEKDDGVLWFAPVGDAQSLQPSHLMGNVAEYLYDDSKGKGEFFVVGGSALSPPDESPEKPYPVDVRIASGGYSDVGLRLAISAPGSVAGRARLYASIRKQKFLRPPS